MDEQNDYPEEPNETEAAPVGIQLFGNTTDVVARYTHCAICGANLHFNHITDFSRNLTQETAKCPECGVKVRQILHRLQ